MDFWQLTLSISPSMLLPESEWKKPTCNIFQSVTNSAWFNACVKFCIGAGSPKTEVCLSSFHVWQQSCLYLFHVARYQLFKSFPPSHLCTSGKKAWHNRGLLAKGVFAGVSRCYSTIQKWFLLKCSRGFKNGPSGVAAAVWISIFTPSWKYKILSDLNTDMMRMVLDTMWLSFSKNKTVPHSQSVTLEIMYNRLTDSRTCKRRIKFVFCLFFSPIFASLQRGTDNCN